MIEFTCDDVLEWARDYDGEKFHALLADPPYNLTNRVVDNPYCPKCETSKSMDSRTCNICDSKLVFSKTRTNRGGFMGKKWDSDIAFQSETWAALAEHLHPGAFGMAFSSCRTVHRLMCAIEDAGLVLHPVIFLWGYGSGFPKATRIDTQIDKAAGMEREVVGIRKKTASASNCHEGWERPWAYDENGNPKRTMDITAPATPLAAIWQGHRYGLQAMKPAVEPVVVFQKPYEGRPFECIVETGAGSLWIDGGRIPGQAGDGWWGNHHRLNSESTFGASTPDESWTPNGNGRWPANFVLVHSPDCDEDGCADDCPVRRLGEQSGTLKSGGSGKCHGSSSGMFFSGDNGEARDISDSGTAARFFFQADWKLEQADPFFYCGKASKSEREDGLFGNIGCVKCGGVDTITHLNEQGQEVKCIRNGHPTVKPLKLIEHLATLLLPPPEYAPRRLLNPFGGSGSEALGAGLAGWEEIVSIELLQENVDIAELRARHWLERDRQLELFGGER